MSISCLAAFFVGDEDVTLFAVSLNQAVHTSYSAVHFCCHCETEVWKTNIKCQQIEFEYFLNFWNSNFV